MKIKYSETVHTEKEINLPYYYIDRLDSQCKAYEHYAVRIDPSNIEIHNVELSDYFVSSKLSRFLDNQEELKAQFNKTLAEIMSTVER